MTGSESRQEGHMFETIIVPVDGSPQDEITAAVGARIARQCKAALRFVRVHVAPPARDIENLPALENDLETLEDAYTRQMADGTRLQIGGTVEGEVLTGPVGEAIAERAAALASPLVVMSTHGRTGFSRLWLGSVADAVVRSSRVPVLLLRIPPRSAGVVTPPPVRFQRVVVPLDGSELAERILEPVITLAALDGGCIHLVRVLEQVVLPEYPFAYVTPRLESAEEFDDRKRQATEYLENLAVHIRARDGIGDVSTEVVVDQAVPTAVLDAAKGRSADLVAIATHGRGASRLVIGSVADKLMRGTASSVLMVRPSTEARDTAATA
jgi:nucleotide-binding universal stress UspA family protein